MSEAKEKSQRIEFILTTFNEIVDDAEDIPNIEEIEQMLNELLNILSEFPILPKHFLHETNFPLSLFFLMQHHENIRILGLNLMSDYILKDYTTCMNLLQRNFHWFLIDICKEGFSELAPLILSCLTAVSKYSSRAREDILNQGVVEMFIQESENPIFPHIPFLLFLQEISQSFSLEECNFIIPYLLKALKCEEYLVFSIDTITKLISHNKFVISSFRRFKVFDMVIELLIPDNTENSPLISAAFNLLTEFSSNADDYNSIFTSIDFFNNIEQCFIQNDEKGKFINNLLVLCENNDHVFDAIYNSSLVSHIYECLNDGSWDTQVNSAVFLLSYFFSRSTDESAHEIIKNEEICEKVVDILESTNIDSKLFILENIYKLLQSGFDFSDSFFISDDFYNSLMSCSQSGEQIIAQIAETLLSIVDQNDE